MVSDYNVVIFILILTFLVSAGIIISAFLFSYNSVHAYDGDSDPNMNKKDLEKTICEFIYNGYFDGKHCLMKTDAV